MDLTSIISISGRPGLFKVVAQGKNSIIVESLTDKKRFPAYASDKISALNDISIYSYEEDVPLTTILQSIYEKENGNSCISHKEDINALKTYLLDIYPSYDQERVYPSDVKKIFQWYNLLHESGNLKMEETESIEKESEKDEEAKAGKKATTAAKKTTTAKKTTAKASPKVSKTSTTKKATPVKTGTSRGK
jgi:hypothetical protein